MLRRTTFSAGLPQYVHFVSVAAASVIVLPSVDFQCRLIEAASVNLSRFSAPCSAPRFPHLAGVTHFVFGVIRRLACMVWRPPIRGVRQVPEPAWRSKFVFRAMPVSGDRSAKIPNCERAAGLFRPFAVAVCRCDRSNMYHWFTLSQVPKVHIFSAGMKKPAQWRAMDQIGRAETRSPVLGRAFSYYLLLGVWLAFICSSICLFSNDC